MSLPNANGMLVGGLFADGHVASEVRTAPVLPLAAVDERGLQAVRHAHQERTWCEKTEVELGIRDAATETVEIRSGVQPGDTILLGAARGISEKTPVKVSARGYGEETVRHGARQQITSARRPHQTSTSETDDQHIHVHLRFRHQAPARSPSSRWSRWSIFGIFALLKLKTDEFPDVAPPWLTVGIVYPGASPDVVESEVLKPVEEQIGSITGVKRIMGKAYDGYALLMIEFLFDKDLERGVAGRARRDLGDPRRPADGDEGADHQEVQRHRSADRVAGDLVDARCRRPS